MNHMYDRKMQAFKVIRQIDDIEHVFIVVAETTREAKKSVADMHGYADYMYTEPDCTLHPWCPTSGLWSVSPLSENHGPIKLYEFNHKTGEMK